MKMQSQGAAQEELETIFIPGCKDGLRHSGQPNAKTVVDAVCEYSYNE